MSGIQAHVDTHARLASTVPTSIMYHHHPISCRNSKILRLDVEGYMECDHGEAPPGDPITTHAVNASVAVLLFELLHERTGGGNGR